MIQAQSFEEAVEVAKGCPGLGFEQAVEVRAFATAVADNRLSIAEIAQMAGFTDQSHLNRLFRRCFNLTPQEVRRMQNS